MGLDEDDNRNVVVTTAFSSELSEQMYKATWPDDPITRELYAQILDEEIAKLGGREKGQIGKAADLLNKLVLADSFEEFLTLPAYDQLAG